MRDEGTSTGEVASGEAGSLLAELMVAAGLLLVGVLVVGMTLGGPIRGIDRAALPSERFEGSDRVGLELVTLVRAARPNLRRPAVITAETGRLVLALDHLHLDERGEIRWSMTIVGDAISISETSDIASPTPRVVLRSVDAERSRFRYRDADGQELEVGMGLTLTELARISSIELHLVVFDLSGEAPEVEVTHRAALRIVGPLA
jgi:hypothetical protein